MWYIISVREGTSKALRLTDATSTNGEETLERKRRLQVAFKIYYIMLNNEAKKLNLTRKHFTLIAEVLGHIDDKGNREGTAQAYAILFEQTHPRFDRAKFEAYVEEVHADCWADDGHVSEDFYSDV